jgi:hypothetical protein
MPLEGIEGTFLDSSAACNLKGFQRGNVFRASHKKKQHSGL